jgi:hypothetical protein
METEKSAAQSEEEKKAIDKSGFSEKQMDLNVNRQPTGSPQQGKKVSVYQAKKKEKVLLEIT